MDVRMADQPTTLTDERASEIVAESNREKKAKAKTLKPQAFAAEAATPSPVIQPAEHVYTPPFDITTLSLEELSSLPETYNRELSWLDFNWRVLNEALDERTPLLERLRFIAISASNLDEFFRKRVGGLKRQQAAGLANLILPGWTPDFQLELVTKAVEPMLVAQSRCLYEEILPALANHGMRLLSYSELSDEQRERLRTYYLNEIYPILTPLAVDSGHPFPFISNQSLNLAVLLRDPFTEEMQFARLKVPPNRPRWIILENPQEFVPLEQVLIHNLDVLFSGMEIVAAHPFRVTRNASIERNEEEADDLLEMISEELRERRFASVVRLEVDESMPESVRTILQNELKLSQLDIYPVSGLLGLADLFPLADMNLPLLKYKPWTPVISQRFAGLTQKSRPSDMFSLLRQGHILVHHPYHSFSASTQRFIESAARDPQVMAIKQTVYRTNDKSPVIQALIQAAESGKQVAVLVELKARFDEERNIGVARTLENAGCHVTYGLVGLKTHAKLSLAVREEEDGLRTYYHVGTGNYNAKTATLYTDFGLYGCQPELAADLMDVFNFLTGYSRQTVYRKILVAPVNMRQRFLDLIDTEAAHALAGRPARLIIQMNGLDDQQLVQKLYEASQAGVQCDLIVRGNCRLRPGLPGISDNIRVLSVIGRFLEHPRIFYFENNGDPRYFMGSADWMSRNLNNRVEVVVPIEDQHLQLYVRHVLDTLLSDHRQAWEMMPDGRYQQRQPREDVAGLCNVGTHEHMMQYIGTYASQIGAEFTNYA